MNFENPSRLDLLLDSVLHHGIVSSLYEEYADSLELSGSESVLDYGCGTGALSKHIAKRLQPGGGRLTCADASKPLLGVARSRLKGLRNLDFKHVESVVPQLEPNAFDVVVIHFALHHIKPALRLDAVGALTNSLKDDGCLCVREPVSESHGLSRSDVRELMANVSLEESSCDECAVKLFNIVPFMKTYAGVFRKSSVL